jgi:DNA-binding LacI/PurR family transcriptional regulator
MRNRQPTIRDVAREAGVSITTVSYVFNGRGAISPATRERVRACAEALHYRPNALIRSLQQRRSNLIGAYLWPLGLDPARFIAAELLRGITEALAATELDLLIHAHHPGQFDSSVVAPFLDKRIDGLIWTPAPETEGVLEELSEAGLPTVSVMHDPVPEGIGSVTADNAGGARAIVEHLLELGHRRIAVSGSLCSSDRQDRVAGYRQAVAAGGEADSTLEMLCQDGWPNPAETLQRARAAGATALFCLTDAHALRVVQQAYREGVRVPRELSIAGFDDVPAARLGCPPLTTARLPAAEIGAEAVRHLRRLLGGAPAEEARSVLPVELQVRETTGPPPGARSSGAQPGR